MIPIYGLCTFASHCSFPTTAFRFTDFSMFTVTVDIRLVLEHLWQSNNVDLYKLCFPSLSHTDTGVISMKAPTVATRETVAYHRIAWNLCLGVIQWIAGKNGSIVTFRSVETVSVTLLCHCSLRRHFQILHNSTPLPSLAYILNGKWSTSIYERGYVE